MVVNGTRQIGCPKNTWWDVARRMRKSICLSREDAGKLRVQLAIPGLPVKISFKPMCV